MSETTESVEYLHIINNDKQSDQKKLSARSPSSFTVWKNKCFNNSLTWHNKPVRRKLGLGSNFPVNLALEHGNMGEVMGRKGGLPKPAQVQQTSLLCNTIQTTVNPMQLQCSIVAQYVQSKLVQYRGTRVNICVRFSHNNLARRKHNMTVRRKLGIRVICSSSLTK